jgi:hypothetical protein
VNKEVFYSKKYDKETPFLIGSLDYANELMEDHQTFKNNLVLFIK